MGKVDRSASVPGIHFNLSFVERWNLLLYLLGQNTHQGLLNILITQGLVPWTTPDAELHTHSYRWLWEASESLPAIRTLLESSRVILWGDPNYPAVSMPSWLFWLYGDRAIFNHIPHGENVSIIASGELALRGVNYEIAHIFTMWANQGWRHFSNAKEGELCLLIDALQLIARKSKEDLDDRIQCMVNPSNALTLLTVARRKDLQKTFQKSLTVLGRSLLSVTVSLQPAVLVKIDPENSEPPIAENDFGGSARP